MEKENKIVSGSTGNELQNKDKKPQIVTEQFLDRMIKEVPAPIATPLSHIVLFKKKTEDEPIKTIDIPALQTHLLGEGRLLKKKMLFGYWKGQLSYLLKNQMY